MVRAPGYVVASGARAAVSASPVSLMMAWYVVPGDAEVARVVTDEGRRVVVQVRDDDTRQLSGRLGLVRLEAQELEVEAGPVQLERGLGMVVLDAPRQGPQLRAIGEQVRDLPLAGGRVSFRFDRTSDGRTAVEVLDADAIRVAVEEDQGARGPR